MPQTRPDDSPALEAVEYHPRLHRTYISIGGGADNK